MDDYHCTTGIWHSSSIYEILRQSRHLYSKRNHQRHIKSYSLFKESLEIPYRSGNSIVLRFAFIFDLNDKLEAKGYGLRERFHYLTILLVVYEDKLVVIRSLITWWLCIVVSDTMYDNHLEIRGTQRLFCEISVRRNKNCLEFFTTWGGLKILDDPSIHVQFSKSLRFSEI